MTNEVDYSKIYEEVTTPRDGKTKPKFPGKCPICKAATVDLDRTPGTGHALYACGGDYTPKPQIQNHTDKWWGAAKSPNRASSVRRFPSKRPSEAATLQRGNWFRETKRRER